MRLLRFMGKLIGWTILMLFLATVSWIIYERNRDHLKSFPTPSPSLNAIQTVPDLDSITAGLRYYQDVTILTERQDTISASISFPVGYENKKLPVVTILGGLEIGRENFALISDPGENILIIYEYPYSPEYWYEGNAIDEILNIRQSIFSVPAQVIDLSIWVMEQPWADKDKTALLGYSFGSFFLPATYHMASVHEIPLGPAVLAYGGADIELLTQTNLKLNPEPVRNGVAWLVATILSSMDPLHHAPYMSGEFYLINGLKDTQIPTASWQQLHALVPDPKKIDLLDEGHMHPRKPELTEKLVDMSRNWLLMKGVINP